MWCRGYNPPFNPKVQDSIFFPIVFVNRQNGNNLHMEKTLGANPNQVH
jgi:hypothetical protein